MRGYRSSPFTPAIDVRARFIPDGLIRKLLPEAPRFGH